MLNDCAPNCTCIAWMFTTPNKDSWAPAEDPLATKAKVRLLRISIYLGMQRKWHPCINQTTHASSSSSWSVGNRLIRKPLSSLVEFWAFMLPISRARRFSSSLARGFGLLSVCSRTQRAFSFQNERAFLSNTFLKGVTETAQVGHCLYRRVFGCVRLHRMLRTEPWHWKKTHVRVRSIIRICAFFVCTGASWRGTCWFRAWWLCYRAGPTILLWWDSCNFLLRGTQAVSLLYPRSQTSCGNPDAHDDADTARLSIYLSMKLCT